MDGNKQCLEDARMGSDKLQAGELRVLRKMIDQVVVRKVSWTRSVSYLSLRPPPFVVGRDPTGYMCGRLYVPRL